jgi:hypothetical protein
LISASVAPAAFALVLAIFGKRQAIGGDKRRNRLGFLGLKGGDTTEDQSGQSNCAYDYMSRRFRRPFDASGRFMLGRAGVARRRAMSDRISWNI